jgi:AMIN domain-containing protein
MMRARHLAAFLLLVPLAGAQEPRTVPAEVTGVIVSVQQGTEIRIELSVSAPVSEAQVVATYPDSLILDVPGAVYHGLPRRISVNAAGVRAVRVWMQSEDPALTRVVVEIDQNEEYLVSSDKNGIVLRIGTVLEGVANRTAPNTAEVSGSREPSPAGRGSASANAVNKIGGIFRRGPSKPTTYGNSKIRDAQPVPQGDSAAQTAQSEGAAQGSFPENAPLPTTTAVATPLPPKAQNSPASKSGEAEKSPGTLSASNSSLGPPAKTQTPPQIQPQPASETEAAPPSPTSEIASADRNKPPAASPASSTPVGSTERAIAEADAPPSSSLESATPAKGTSNPALEKAALVPVANPGMRTEFQVKYVEQDTAYLDGGRSSGLAEGMKLFVKNKGPMAGADKNGNADGAVAELVVVGVAETSSVTEIHLAKREVVAGDLAYLSSTDLQALVQQNALSATRKYPAVITFSEGGDALDEEARADVPRPPLPSVNRANLRLGFDYSGTQSKDSSQLTSSSLGALIQADVTRIGGTHWGLRGYWRGRLTSTSAASRQTLQDLINRTYHLSLTYENPDSRWVAGVGRLYLPWATSLETLDGGYFGARLGHGITSGLFGGSTPDPTSWSYSPNRHIGGAFLNETGGSFDAVHFSSTAGFGKSFNTVDYSTTSPTGTTTPASYQDNRPFAFFENSISYKSVFSIFSALQADKPSANPAVPSPGAGISQSFLTVRLQPVKHIEFSVNETYFRDVPTFDPQLVGTGLLDKYLFQGFSGGVRVEAVKNIVLYADLGRSSRTGDAKTSLNQMYGITLLKIPKLALHADAHYSRFNSSFGSGTYRAFSLSRNLGEGFHVELLAGDQVFTSSLAGNQNAKFITTNVDTSLGAMFFLQGGFTAYRGQLQNYNQWDVIIGYRFDNKWKHK